MRNKGNKQAPPPENKRSRSRSQSHSSQQQQHQQHQYEHHQHQHIHQHVSQPTQQQMYHPPPHGPAPVPGSISAGPHLQQQQHQQHQLYTEPNPNAGKEKNKKKKKEKIRDPFLMPVAVSNKKLSKIHFWAELLDAKYSCCCMFRFGIEPIIGLIPILGDFAGVIASLMLVACIRRHFDLPAFIVTQMFVNVAIDFVVGLVPILGDIVDMFFKANMRNHSLVKKYVEERQREAANVQLEAGMAAGYKPPQHPQSAASYIPHVSLQPGAKRTVARAALKKLVQNKA